jgi:hypothetical protein
LGNACIFERKWIGWAMLDNLFDIKHDRRLSIYLYRLGFVFWLMYLVLGAPALYAFAHYRNQVGVGCMTLMVVGFSCAMVYDAVNHPQLYEQKKKWLVISYMLLFSCIYFFILKDQGFQLNWTSLLQFRW